MFIDPVTAVTRPRRGARDFGVRRLTSSPLGGTDSFMPTRPGNAGIRVRLVCGGARFRRGGGRRPGGTCTPGSGVGPKPPH